jgi:hypothetical protein
MAKHEIMDIQDRLDTVNRERAEAEHAARQEAIALRRQRDDLYLDACRKRDAIGVAGIANGQVVMVYDPDLLDADTLAILEHMGTPVPPVDEVYPDGVTIPGKKGT